MTAIRANGTDLFTAFSFAVVGQPGWLSSAPRRLGRASLYGRAGGMVTTLDQYESRPFQLAGSIQKTTVSLRKEAERQLDDLLSSGIVQLVVDDGDTPLVGVEGYKTRMVVEPFGHSLAPLTSRVTVDFDCPFPYSQELEPTSRVITTTARALALGNAPSSPIIRIMGAATNPVLTYRDAGGTAQKTLTITGTLAATNDWLDIDMRTGVIRKYASGVITNGFESYTITGDFPWAFDPQDGDYLTSGWPTLTCSAGTCIAYWWKAFQSS